MEEIKIFLITYFAALLGVIPPGLVNMTVAKTCLKSGKEKGLYVAAGAATIVLLQATLAIMLTKYIFKNDYVNTILLRTGFVIFLILMIYFLVMAQRKRKRVEVSSASNFKSFVKGLIMGTLNVFPIPYFVALGAALNVNGNVEHYLLNDTVFVLGASLGTFSTLYLYVIFFGKIETNSDLFIKYSNYFMAGLMLVLVIITFIRIYY